MKMEGAGREPPLYWKTHSCHRLAVAVNVVSWISAPNTPVSRESRGERKRRGAGREPPLYWKTHSLLRKTSL
jgi:hypothetical protein